MGTYVITGANRGIGLAMCRQLKARGDTVVAVCRHSSPELNAVGVKIIEGVDVGKPADVERLREQLDGS